MVGVVKSRNMIKINGPLDDNIVVPISTLMSIYNRGTNVGATFFIVRPGYTPADIKDKVWRAIRAGHPMISPDDDTAISMWDISEQFKMVDNMMTGVNVLLLFVGFSSLLAGIIGVGNIMWIIVKERTHEFGIRRALGARPATVLRQILSESAVLTVIAGTGGIVFAVAMLGAANLGMEAAGTACRIPAYILHGHIHPVHLPHPWHGGRHDTRPESHEDKADRSIKRQVSWVVW